MFGGPYNIWLHVHDSTRCCSQVREVAVLGEPVLGEPVVRSVSGRAHGQALEVFCPRPGWAKRLTKALIQFGVMGSHPRARSSILAVITGNYLSEVQDV